MAFTLVFQQPQCPGTDIIALPHAHGKIVALAAQMGALVDDQQIHFQIVIKLQHAAEIGISAAVEAVYQQHGTPAVGVSQILCV